MLILIPAYEPDLRLVTLIRDLGHHLPDARVLVVDDGSGAAFDGVFEVSVDAGATLEEASQKVFGRPHAAVYRLRGGLAVIGTADEPPVE